MFKVKIKRYDREQCAFIQYLLNGVLHREDGPAEELKNGSCWCKNGKRHRENGPAIEWDDGSFAWYLDGKKHRVDGPAIKYADDDTEEWWLYGCNLNYEEWLKHVQS